LKNEKTDIFLDDLNKKKISNKIRYKEKKIQHESTVSFNLSLIIEINDKIKSNIKTIFLENYQSILKKLELFRKTVFLENN